MISSNIKELTGSNILHDRLESFKDEGDLARAIIADYKENSLKQLLAFYNATETRDIPEKERDLRTEILQIYIAKKLGVSGESHIWYLVDNVNAICHVLEKRIKELEKYKEHRHKTILGLYTEKGVY